jgi:hypothetical protein
MCLVLLFLSLLKPHPQLFDRAAENVGLELLSLACVS